MLLTVKQKKKKKNYAYLRYFLEFSFFSSSPWLFLCSVCRHFAYQFSLNVSQADIFSLQYIYRRTFLAMRLIHNLIPRFVVLLNFLTFPSLSDFFCISVFIPFFCYRIYHRQEFGSLSPSLYIFLLFFSHSSLPFRLSKWIIIIRL